MNLNGVSLFRYLRQNVVAFLALFVALGAGGAYAANTIGSADIIDGQVKSADIGNDEIGSADVKDNSINTFDVHSFLGADVVDESLTSADIQNFSLGNGDFLTGSVDSRAATDNSLTGTDIDESTLNLPQTPTTATFASGGFVALADSFRMVAGKTLSGGSWAVTATANTTSDFFLENDVDRDTVCELRNGTGHIGGATDRRRIPSRQVSNVSLSMNGGAQVPSGGGFVSLWCRFQGGGSNVTDSQMMMIRLDGFS